MIKSIIKTICLVGILTSCTHLPTCHKNDDIIERTKCYENEKQQRFYNNIGWRYYEHRLERANE